jgi:hypothetical protein
MQQRGIGWQFFIHLAQNHSSRLRRQARVLKRGSLWKILSWGRNDLARNQGIVS